MKRDTVIKEFSAGGVVIKKENNQIKYLLIKDGNGHWTLPKGHIEGEEEIKEAALREIQEETGLTDLKIVRNLETIKYFYCRDNDLILKMVHLFLIEARGNEELKPQRAEITGARWVDGKEALKLASYKNTKDILQKAIGGGVHG